MINYSFPQLHKELLHVIECIYSMEPTSDQLLGVHLQIVDASQKNRGDLTTNAALMLARYVRRAPHQVAQELLTEIKYRMRKEGSPFQAVGSADIAGPGFLNFTLKDEVWAEAASRLATDAERFFRWEHTTPPSSYLIEFVSANPTGPLHLGHGRIGIVGDVLKRVLSFCRHKAHAEFYINDAGVQMQKMGACLKIRCQQLAGEDVAIPEDGYHGEYLIDIAQKCIDEHGTDVISKNTAFFTEYGYKIILAQQKIDLADFGITFDRWFSERTLHDSDSVTKSIVMLTQSNLMYHEDGALWFRSTRFGDDKDRVIKKKDGTLTYIAADIAYHVDKYTRKYTNLVNILGQDHHGYIRRLQGTMMGLGYAAYRLKSVLCQLVSIKKGSVPVRMSKRAGNFTSLRDVIDTVGVDAARFFFLHKKVESHLELDIEVALKKNQENPVFYLQYAYVRTKSLEQKAQEAGLKMPTQEEMKTCVFDSNETAIFRKILGFNHVIRMVEESYATHLIAQYGLELAQTFHSFYTNNKIINPDDMQTTHRRLILVQAMQQALGVVHDLLGLQKREQM